MDTDKSTAPVIQEYPVPYLLFTLLLAICIGIFVGLENMASMVDIQNNWSQYRCQPQMMPLAGLFGYSINENFEFCLQQIIQESTKGITGPFASSMFGFTSILTNLMNSANSFRTMLATLVGGVIKIINEFKARMTAMMGRVKLTASRMKTLMYRVYGTMFAVIYMGLSAQTGISNFGDTFIFKFIDTFCFPPEQPVTLDDGTIIPISEVLVGDILQGGHTVETIYTFAADGQEMVQLGEIQVSSNHFLKHNGKWIMAKDHPDAVSIGGWAGGAARPLVCLTTHDHLLPVGPYMFADYDETDEGNAETQAWVDKTLNGKTRKDTPSPAASYEVGLPSSTMIKTLTGYKPLYEIQLGDKISETDTVVGIQISETDEFCRLSEIQRVTRGSLIWNQEKGEWLRAYSFLPEAFSNKTEVIALFVSPGAKYEIMGGHVIRDAMEVYSPDTKKSYAEHLLKK